MLTTKHQELVQLNNLIKQNISGCSAFIQRKMKLFILILILPIYIFGQSSRFIYKYRSLTDTLKKDTTITEMYLDVHNKESIFYDIQNYKNDSIASSHGEKLTNFENIVFKQYPNAISLITKLYNDTYIVSDPRKMVWNILPEKKKINEFLTQKATLDFGGRTWTAWFSTEIPIPDGPYKFHGLPGLIVKIEDHTLTHIFELIAVKKTDALLNDKINRQKSLSIDQKTYTKLYREYRENPNKNINRIDIVETQDGKSGSEFKRNMENYYKNRLKKDNNIIEIDLLRKK